MEEFFSFRNFRQFEYSRKAITLPYDLLSDIRFRQLPDVKKAHLICLLLLAAGCLLRVGAEILAYQALVRSAWSWLAVSAICEMAAVSIFAFNLLVTFAREGAASTAPVIT